MAKNNHPIWNLIGWRTTGDLGGYTIYTTQRGETVVYPRAPALNPATQAQARVRWLWQTACISWNERTPAQKAEWQKATRLLRMGITGFNFYVSTAFSFGGGYVEYARQRTGLTLFFPS